MALEGSLTDFGLADILQLIYFQRKTGYLTLSSRLDRVRLIFVDGNIAGAESKRRMEDNRLGKILVKKGLIAESDLTAVLQEQKSSGNRLGQEVVKRGLVSREALSEILTSQISETVVQLFDWKQGTYEFVAQAVQHQTDGFSIDTQHILMDGLRISDEWSLIKGRITLDTVFGKTDTISSVLSGEEEDLLSFVDGENDVSTIIDLSGMDSFRVSKALLALEEKGAIQVLARRPEVSLDETVDKRRPKFLAFLPGVAVVASVVISFLVFFAAGRDPLRQFTAAGRIEDLRFRIEAYRLKHDAYPAELALVSSEKDPWGRDYFYKVEGDHFSLSSGGPDGKYGTRDDIY